MRREIPWSLIDIQSLFIPDKSENILVNEIRKTINCELIIAYEKKHNLVLLCNDDRGITHVKIDNNGVHVPFNDGNPTSDSDLPTEDFKKAISDFKKKWGEKIIKKKLKQGTQYCFLMF